MKALYRLVEGARPASLWKPHQIAIERRRHQVALGRLRKTRSHSKASCRVNARRIDCPRRSGCVSALAGMRRAELSETQSEQSEPKLDRRRNPARSRRSPSSCNHVVLLGFAFLFSCTQTPPKLATSIHLQTSSLLSK